MGHEIAAAFIVVGGIFIGVSAFKGKYGCGWAIAGVVLMVIASGHGF